MRTELIRSRRFSRRALLLGGAEMLLFSGLAGRLYYLQVLQSEKYQTLSEDNRIHLIPVVPSRGKFLDRNGVVLAEGETRYQVWLNPAMTKKPKETLERIITLLALDEEVKLSAEKMLERGGYRAPVLVKDFLEWEQVAKIEVNVPDLQGIAVFSPEVRFYPYGAVFAPLLGYVAEPSEKDFELYGLDEVVYKHAGFKVGKAGLEKTLEIRVRGKPGARQVEVDAYGTHIRELEQDEGTPGKDVRLTIDADLQHFVTSKLSNKGGLTKEGATAVVLDIHTGDVLSLASVPSYDPNEFVRGVSPEYWKELRENPDKPMGNKATVMHYPPGSTFKLITALAALEAGVITPETTAYCPGYYELGGRKFHCWHKDGHGTVALTEAIQKSCNVYFYTIGRKIGVNKIAEMARQFGLGSQTGIELPNEKKGLVPDEAWKRAVQGKPWYGGETLNTAIGQGALETTPLQLVQMVARIANMGLAVKPHLLEKKLVPHYERLHVSARHIHSVQRGMRAVVNDAGGTVYRYRIEDPAYAFAGKTGTAQVRSRLRFKNVPAERALRYHSIFVGYAPVSAPKWAVSVLVEHGGYGSVVAGPIARDIFRKLQGLDVEEDDDKT